MYMQIQVQLNFDISNTVISNTVNMLKWFVTPNNFFLNYFTRDISNTWISKFLNSSI